MQKYFRNRATVINSVVKRIADYVSLSLALSLSFVCLIHAAAKAR